MKRLDLITFFFLAFAMVFGLLFFSFSAWHSPWLSTHDQICIICIMYLSNPDILNQYICHTWFSCLANTLILGISLLLVDHLGTE